MADLFEALTAADRPYKKQMTLARTLEIMENSVKRQEIDPYLFELFKARKIYERFSNHKGTASEN